MKTKYIIKINGQTLTRNSKRSDFTHAVIGREWSGCENEEADANFRIIGLRTNLQDAKDYLRGWTMSHKDAQVVEVEIG